MAAARMRDDTAKLSFSTEKARSCCDNFGSDRRFLLRSTRGPRSWTPRARGTLDPQQSSARPQVPQYLRALPPGFALNSNSLRAGNPALLAKLRNAFVA